jgi:hypothetical protein
VPERKGISARFAAVRLFIRKHRRMLISSGGALIVFLTFVVKEGVKEHYKDLATSVDSAESLFIICDSIRVPPNVFDEVFKAQGRKPQEMIDETIRIMRQEEGYISASLTTTKRLLYELPDQQARIDKVEKLQLSYASKSIDEHTAYVTELDESVINVYKNPKKKGTPEPLLGVAVAGKVWDFVKIGNEAKNLADESLRVAEEIRHEAEWRYEMATQVSYVIYGIGWVLAIVGRVYGVQASGVE